jgi:acetyl esterase/lipase
MRDDILSRAPPKAAARVPYGTLPSQFCDLFLPAGAGPHPVIIALHGGFWRVRYDLTHFAHLCHALTKQGYAVWCPEYRRLGEAGGGWPGTFDDTEAAAAHLLNVAAAHKLDLSRVLTLGHSAGGHLALWLAARSRRHHAPPALSIRGVVGLAAVSDLADAAERALSNGVVKELLGGTPAEQPQRYAQASPRALLPLGVPQQLVHGRDDDIVPFEMSRQYAEAARKAGDAVTLVPLEKTGHFEVIDPLSGAWPRVTEAILALR